MSTHPVGLTGRTRRNGQVSETLLLRVVCYGYWIAGM